MRRQIPHSCRCGLHPSSPFKDQDFRSGKRFWKKCLLVKRLMVWETLNFYKDGGIKGVSGAILTLKKPSCIRAFSYQCYPLYCTTPCRSFLGSFLNVQFSSSQQLCTRINSFHMAYLHNVLWFIKINKKKSQNYVKITFQGPYFCLKIRHSIP